MLDFDFSDLVDQIIRMQDSVEPEPEPQITKAQAEEEYQGGACEHHCSGCKAAIASADGKRATCRATGKIVGEEAFDLSCYETYINYFDGMFDCNECGAMTPGSGDATLILCPRCRAKSNLIFP